MWHVSHLKSRYRRYFPTKQVQDFQTIIMEVRLESMKRRGNLIATGIINKRN